MNTEIKQDTGLPAAELEVKGNSAAPLQTHTSATEEASEQWQQIWSKASELLADLPDYVGEFFQEYRRPIVTVGLLFGAIIAAKLTLAILNAINDIPLLAPTFELIGLGYTGWFVYRYLLRASNRQELVEDFNSLKDQVLGKGS